jgi:hypothetical protein
MKRTTKNAAKKAQLAVLRRNDHNGLLAHFAQCPELFALMLNLIASGKQTIEAVMNQAGRAVVELLLQLSATSIAGQKSPGRQSGEVLWHGSQGGQICLLERRLKVSKPRLRTRGRRGRELAIPLYEQLQGDSGLAARMSEILVSGSIPAQIRARAAGDGGQCRHCQVERVAGGERGERGQPAPAHGALIQRARHTGRVHRRH